MWIQHLFSLLGTALLIFFNAIGTTLLGWIVDALFAARLVIQAYRKTLGGHGWTGVLAQWRRKSNPALIFFLGSAAAIYSPIFAWSVAKAVYEDHQYLVQRSHNLSVRVSDDAADLRKAQDDCSRQISELKIKDAGTSGQNTQLQSQNRDQQNTINNCQTQAIKLLTPQPLKWLPMALDRVQTGALKKSEWLLVTNKSVTPVDLFVYCDTEITAVEPRIVASPTTQQTARLDNSQWEVKITSPAWDSVNPILINTTNTGQGDTTCLFTLRGGPPASDRTPVKR